MHDPKVLPIILYLGKFVYQNLSNGSERYKYQSL